MTDTELLVSCVEAINSGINPPVITLIIKGQRQTLTGKGSPRGQVVEERKGENVLAFDAIDVLAYMTAKGRIRLKPADPVSAE